MEQLVDALMVLHRGNAQVRGVVYQNLERLKLLNSAQNATEKIHARGTAAVPGLDPVKTWVAISAINALVHATSQAPGEQQSWSFARALVRHILAELLSEVD